ncbi:hypothetical protein DFH09DRAFT_1160096 [Mycena vulgaris]|nr:hypothetical protein DFH09DRAFT_1160096 [Mycena vulgaris]
MTVTCGRSPSRIRSESAQEEGRLSENSGMSSGIGVTCTECAKQRRKRRRRSTLVRWRDACVRNRGVAGCLTMKIPIPEYCALSHPQRHAVMMRQERHTQDEPRIRSCATYAASNRDSALAALRRSPDGEHWTLNWNTALGKALPSGVYRAPFCEFRERKSTRSACPTIYPFAQAERRRKRWRCRENGAFSTLKMCKNVVSCIVYCKSVSGANGQ